MAAIESSIRTMITKGTTMSAAGVPDSRVTHGYRLQDSALPAITYSVTSKEDAATGRITTGTLSVSCIASTSSAALTLTEALRGVLVDGTYDTFDISGVTIVSEQLEPEVIGLGDEQEPAISTTTAIIYWS